MKKKPTNRIGAQILGAGLAVAAATAAGYYYFYGSPKSKQHKKSAVKWAHEMKKQVVKESRRIQKMSPQTIAAAVNSVTKTYRDLKKIDPKELAKVANELKSNWKKIKNEASKSQKTTKKLLKKSSPGRSRKAKI